MKVFLSYRRTDDRHLAGRLRDVLAAQLGKENVFFDVDSLAAGQDFRLAIRRLIDLSDVMVVLIGPRWDSSRLFASSDVVRLELTEAIRQSKPLIPVLVENTQMPTPDQLPDELQELAYRNAVVVRPDPDFHDDAARLARAVASLASPPPPPQPLPVSPPPPPRPDIIGEVSAEPHPKHRRILLVAAIAVGATATGAALVWSLVGDDAEDGTTTTAQVAGAPPVTTTCAGEELPPQDQRAAVGAAGAIVQRWLDVVAAAGPGADNPNLYQQTRELFPSWGVELAEFSEWAGIERTDIVWMGDDRDGWLAVAGFEYSGDCSTKFVCWNAEVNDQVIVALVNEEIDWPDDGGDRVSNRWVHGGEITSSGITAKETLQQQCNNAVALVPPTRPRTTAAITASHATTSIVPVTTTTAPPPSTTLVRYIVQPGDTLFGIARKNDVPLAELLAANGLTESSPIEPGQQLVIP